MKTGQDVVAAARLCCMRQGELLRDIMEARPGRPNDAVPVDAGATMAMFHRGRLEEARPAFEAFVLETVPDEFFEGRGGGALIDKLGFNRQGERWAEMSEVWVFLAMLMALKMGRFLVQASEHWPALFPEGPHVVLRHPAEPIDVKHLVVGSTPLCAYPTRFKDALTPLIDAVTCRGCLLVFPLVVPPQGAS